MQVVNEKIIHQINKGDSKAFEELYNAYYVYLCAVATKFVYVPEIAQEVVNDVFLRVWENRSTLVYPCSSYLIRAVQNRCLNHLKKRQLEEVSLSDVEDNLIEFQKQQITQDEHPLSFLENKEFEETVNRAIQKLPEKCREIFEQYLYLNLSYDEIASLNKITPSTVRGQVRIALAKLKEQLRHFTLSFFSFVY